MHDTIRILGIDPGLRITGWGVIESTGDQLRFIDCGTVRTDNTTTLSVRLATLYTGLQRILHNYAPDEAAVEQTFVNRDARASLKLGHARGVAMLAPAFAGLSVAEYAPSMIKKTVVGVGRCEKAQIRTMVGVLLPKAQILSNDAADALAIAITHVQHRSFTQLARTVQVIAGRK